MPTVIEGTYSGKGVKLTLVVSRFNDMICNELVRGAQDAFVRYEGNLDDVTIVRCPGAFEIPRVTRFVAEKGDSDAIICLGAVIRGSTPHFDYIAAEVTKGVAHLSMEHSMPIVYGVLTTDTIEQALERAGIKLENRGAECVRYALEMLSLYRKLDG